MLDPIGLTLINLVMVFVMKLTCFVIGYQIIRLGAQLIREGITGGFKFRAELKGLRGDLASASPGLLFLMLGVILIGYAMWVPKNYDIVQMVASQSSPKPPPNVPIPR